MTGRDLDVKKKTFFLLELTIDFGTLGEQTKRICASFQLQVRIIKLRYGRDLGAPFVSLKSNARDLTYVGKSVSKGYGNL